MVSTRRFRPRWRNLIALLLTALLALALAPTFAQEGPPAEPLVPNIEPAELEGALAATPAWALSEREAVEAALAAYLADDQGAALVDYAPPELVSEARPSAQTRVYLPLVRRGAEPNQGPGQGPTPTPTPTPAPPPPPPADVTVTIWPKPSIIVGRGALLEYEIRLRNTGKGTATRTQVTFPYNRQQVALSHTSLDSGAGDWLSTIGNDSYTVTFGSLDSGAERVGRVFVRVGSGLPNQTVLDVRARYNWSDRADGGSRNANWAPVLIGDGPADAPYVWVRVDPDRGPAGTTHSFFTNRLQPGEGVSTWLNVPGGGVRALDLRGSTDAQGQVTLNYRSGGLSSGTYQMVLYGQSSRLTGVVSFVVQ
jgi:hypothetical protein